MPERPYERFTVALQGFSEFERRTLASFFRLDAGRSPAYVQVEALDGADFVIADADHAGSLAAVAVARRVDDTVFIGSHAPEGAMACLPRPIDPMHIVRELDSLVGQRHPERRPVAAAPALAPSPVLEAKGSDVDLLIDDMGLRMPAAAPATGTGPEVLLVEDSSVARRFLQLRLERLGYRVQLASDGNQAMEALSHRYFSLVFLDVVLGPPGSLDGLQICRHIKQHPRFAADRPTQVVMVTGLGDSMDKVRGTLAGCDAYLVKPLMEAEFVSTLRLLDPWLAARAA